MHRVYRFYLSTPLPNSKTAGHLYDRFICAFPKFATFLLPGLKRFRILSWGRYVTLTDGKSVLTMLGNYARIMMVELPMWELYYLPKFSLRGKTVLDIGAGCGETAWLFFERGAERVIAVEPNRECLGHLKANRNRNNWNLDILVEEFNPSHLALPHDFLKMDSEGGEVVLLENTTSVLGPCRIELHPRRIGVKACGAITTKFQLRTVNGEDIWGKE